MSAPVSAVLLVRDEADRILPALASVAWADEVLVVDTGSEDGTVELARQSGARVLSLPWEGWVVSRNKAIALARHDWVLLIDADERVTDELRDAIRACLDEVGPEVGGIRTPRLSSFLGRPVWHGTWYPDRKLRLGRRSARLRAEGGRVHESVVVTGPMADVNEPLLHEPYRNVSDMLRKSVLYARLGALDRAERGVRGGVGALFFRPILEFLRCFILKAGFLDGKTGLGVALFHAWSHFLRAAFLLELSGGGRPRRDAPDEARTLPVSVPRNVHALQGRP